MLIITTRYNKIRESDGLSPAMIWALVGQCNWTVYTSCLSNWTVRVWVLTLKVLFFWQIKLLSVPSPVCFLLFLSRILLWMWLIGNRTSCRPIRSVIILVIKQIGLPLRGRQILLIIRMITDWIGLPSVYYRYKVTINKINVIHSTMDSLQSQQLEWCLAMADFPLQYYNRLFSKNNFFAFSSVNSTV